MSIFNLKSAINMGIGFISDESVGKAFSELTKGIVPDEGCKLSVVITQRLICSETRIFFSVCSVDMMNIKTIHKQYSVDDLKELVKKEAKNIL